MTEGKESPYGRRFARVTPPIALSVAGSDSGAGAGLQADLKVFAAFGVYGTSVVTAVTAQNTQGIRASETLPLSLIRAQFLALREDLRPAAIKTGMLGDATVMREMGKLLGRPPLPLVVDPVLRSSSGSSLAEGDALEAYRRDLIPLASILTPNLEEAAMLLGSAALDSPDGMKRAAKELLGLGCRSVYLKGGHLPGSECIDVFYDGNFLELRGERIETKNTHGTGCSLAAALCAQLALGQNLRSAASLAHDYVQAALRGAKDWTLGEGHGPLNHFP